MAALYDFRARVRRAIAPAFGALLAFYFSYHLVQGEHGLIAYLELRGQVAVRQAESNELEAEKSKLAHRVRLLRPDSLDPDLLDEQARRMLGVARPDELVIFTDEGR